MVPVNMASMVVFYQEMRVIRTAVQIVSGKYLIFIQYLYEIMKTYHSTNVYYINDGSICSDFANTVNDFIIDRVW